MLENKKINWREISDVLKRRLLIEILVAVIILVGGFFALHLGRKAPNTPAKYNATSQVLLTLPENKQQVVLDQTVNFQYVNTFADAIGTDLVARPVQKKLATQGVKISLRKLERQVNAHTNNNSSLVEINVTDAKKKRAKQIATVYANIASKQVKSIMGLGAGKVTAKPRVAQETMALQRLPVKRIVVLIAAAVVLGLASGCGVEIFDRRIRSRYFVESTLAATPFILSQQPSAVQLAAVRNAVDIAVPNAQILVAQLPVSSPEMQTAVQALAAHYAADGERVLLLDLATDAALLKQLAVADLPLDYQQGAVTTLPKAAQNTAALLTLAEFEQCIARFKTDFQRIIILANSAQIAGNQQLALHVADARLLFLQQGVTTKKAAFALQQESQALVPFNAVLYFGN